MFWLAALALTAAPVPPPSPSVGANVQAVATVRILSAVRLRFDASAQIAGASLRSATIRTPTGEQQARLYEFE